jgi:hypothetical protein
LNYFYKVNRTALAWKTSDWIIQEIGLALGKGLDLMLLVENGVRSPGGLQGNVEYIPFDRASPEKSFSKILDMITALSPRVSNIAAKTGDMTSVLNEEPKEPAPPPSQGEDWWHPTPGWTRTNFALAYMLVTEREYADPQEISDAYLATDHAGEGDNRRCMGGVQ